MKVLIYGAGAIGIALGTFLQEGNVEVDFLARKETGEEIKKNGIKRDGIFGEYFVPSNGVKVYTNCNEIQEKAYDYILVTVKTTANVEVSRELNKQSQILKETGKIIIMQNGWGNDKEYLKYFSRNKIYSARIITGFERKTRNSSTITVHDAPIIIGSLYNEDIKAVEPLAEVLNNMGMPSKASNEVGKALWAKMLYNCTLNPLGAIMKVNYGKLSECIYTRKIMDKLIEETFDTMINSGFSTYYSSSNEYKKDFYSKLIPNTYDHRASTLQDMEKGIKTEIDSLTGMVIRLANENNVKVPYSEFIYNTIRGLEELNEKKLKNV